MPGGVEAAARLLLNPKVPELRDRAYQGLVTSALLDLPQGGSTAVVGAQVEKLFGLKSVPLPMIDLALVALRDAGTCYRTREGFALTPPAREAVRGRLTEITSARSILTREFLDRLGTPTTKNDEMKMAERAFYLVLDSLIDRLATEISSLMHGAPCEIDSAKIASAIDSVLGQVGEYAEPGFRQRFSSAVRSILNHPTPQFARTFFTIVNANMTLKLLQIDPDFHRLRRETFRDVAVILDTNVIIAAVCEGSDKHFQAIRLLEANRVLGVRTVITRKTLDELRDTLRYATKQYNRMRDEGIDFSLLQHEVVRTFAKRRLRDWDAFIADLSREFTDVIKTLEIEVRNESFRPSGDEIVDVMKVVRQFADSGYDRKPDELVEHDAYNILLVHEERRRNPRAGFHSPWFLTYDRTLRPADAVITKRLRRSFGNAVMPCDAWFDITYQFLAPTVDESFAAEVFTRMVGADVMPAVPAANIEDFYEYLRVETGLPDTEVAALARYIQDRKLEPALERAIAQKQGAKALEIVADAFSDRHHLELQSENDDMRGRFVEMQRKMSSLEEKMKAKTNRPTTTSIMVQGSATFVEQSGVANSIGDISQQIAVKESDVLIAFDSLIAANPGEASLLSGWKNSVESARGVEEKKAILSRALEWVRKHESEIKGAGILAATLTSFLAQVAKP